jgi:hypothetical protein
MSSPRTNRHLLCVLALLGGALPLACAQLDELDPVEPVTVSVACPPSDGYQWAKTHDPLPVFWNHSGDLTPCAHACVRRYPGYAVVYSRLPRERHSEAYQRHELCHAQGWTHEATYFYTLYR